MVWEVNGDSIDSACILVTPNVKVHKELKGSEQEEGDGEVT